MEKEDDFSKEEFNESNWISYKKYLIIGIIVLAILLIIVTIGIFSSRDKINEKLDNTLLDCLEKDNLEGACRKMFLDSQIYLECENLGKLKDRCLYFTAISNGNRMLCPSINDNLLKTKCEREVFVTGEI